MMEKIEEKFREGSYEEVVSILTSVFDKTNSKLPLEDSVPPRSSQLVFLVDSLVKIGNLEGIINWGAKSLSEALGNFKRIENDFAEEKIKWGSTIESILASFTQGFDGRPSIDRETLETKMPNFLSPLVDILVLQLEQSSGNYPYFNTLAPWLITHYILNEHEQKGEENVEIESLVDTSKENMEVESVVGTSKENNEDNDQESNEKDKIVSSFPSTLLLITAHEELGKNSWCCHEDGKLLLYMLDVLLIELNRSLSEEQRLLLHQSLEQAIFCLYSHPSRKTKHKHLRDHGVQSIPLCWSRALQIYKYYLPLQLPDFQSSQTPSISDDNVSFFKKALLLLSNEYKHSNQTEHIDSYLTGTQIGFVEHTFSFPSELVDCYYLIADHYFKNKEWDLAIQYYKLDVSINPDRIDSWAPMGLAKKAQLETLLNSCDVIENEEHFFKEAQMAVKCLDRALFLDEYHTNMWVEKGGLVYMIYSHASRLLKQDLNPDLSIERFEILEKIKEDMMQESIKCFKRTLQIVEQGLDDDSLPDERWLYRYMLGKLAEKSLKPPKEILDHYLCAAEYLHQNGAKYPSKISYNNPQEYAVEALEMYFRIYTYMFKYLHFREGKTVEPDVLELFRKTVNKVSVSPFVKGAEKKETKSLVGLSADSLPSDTCKGNTSSKRAVAEETENSNAKKSKNDKIPESFIQNLILEIIDEAVTVSQSKNCSKTKVDNKDDEILVVEEHLEEKESNKIIMKCLDAWKLCITRFSHHYKSLYRISYYYHHSKFHKDNNKARNFLLGSEYWQQLDYMPTNGLFHERKTYLQNPKNCNLFHGVWRIPHDEVDRPGSFAAHMHRCISLCLDILQDTKDFYTVLEVALSLKSSPDKDKKYLRDNERELLSEHSTQVGLQLMKDKFRMLFKNSSSSPSQVNRRQTFLIDVHKAYRYISRHLPCIEGPTSKMLTDSYAAFKNIVVENSNILLREADNWCLRNSLVKRSHPQHVAYGTNAKSPQSGSHTPGSVKRGRPVGSCASKEQSLKLNTVEQQPSAGQSVAVQQAYKVYENLIQAQTILNSKNLDSKSSQYFQKKYEEYKQQMLKYLQIPSVSQFFHASLQSLGTSAAKLPPPPPIQISNSVTTTTISKQGKHSLSSLAARSQAHGISISAVTKTAEVSVSHPIKPNMSITLSPTKANTTKAAKHTVSISQAVSYTPSPSGHQDNLSKAVSHSASEQDDPLSISTCNISQPPSNQTLHAKSTKITHLSNNISTDVPQLKVSKDISIVRTTAQKLSSNSVDISSPLPKLPAGTTLSRHSEVGPSKASSSLVKVSAASKVVEISKISGSIKNRPSNLYAGELASTKNISKTSVTITPSNRSVNADKKQGPVSFQDAFQASIATSGYSLTSHSRTKTDSGSKYNPSELLNRSQSTESKNDSSKHSSSLTITKTSFLVNQPKVNKLLPDVIPLKLKDPLSTTNEEEEIITLD